ncbi:MAG: putative lipid II flippase FtsW, partial [Verrucomicrobia bacterium]|nr:putative lipid II flippase FtsW [Verrucomicrobiota bacterium]
MKLAVNTLVICVVVLLALGMVMLYSSSMADEVRNRQVGAHYLMMQLGWCTFGLFGCIVMAMLDYRLLKKYTLPLLGFAALLLLLVLIPHVGLKINGARRWLGFHSVRFQPSELAKLALIIFIAWYGERFQRQMPKLRDGILIPGAFIVAVLLLIFVEPDRGSTILLATVSAVMLLVAGVRWKYFVPPFVLGVAGFTVSILRDPMRMNRIMAFLHPEEYKSGVGYQAWQAMLALGAGGWTGLGLGNGRQKLGFVPEHHTDFILSIIGEELGLIATLAVVVAFIVIIICGLYIARHARDTFGLLLGAGITFLIGLQAVVNIGVTTAVLPNKGMPMPFISYG